MADDVRALRSAVHRGDGRAVLEAAAAFDQVPLQLLGDALLVAVDAAPVDAGPHASSLARALSDRAWEGDAELAEALEAALQGREPVRPTVPVDLDDLADVLDGNDFGARLDIVTGDVWTEYSIEYAIESDQPEAATFDEPDRWIDIAPNGSSGSYRDMQEFIATISEPDLSERFERAIQGRGAFRRFRGVLQRHPHLEHRWITFSDDRRLGRARAWLADAGYSAVPSRPASGAH